MATAKQSSIARRAFRRIHTLKPTATALAVASCFAVGTAYAQLPTGPHGTIGVPLTNINTVGNTMTVTTTANKAVVNWNSFSIGAPNTVNINQLSSTSAILNRVTTTAPTNVSNILGTLNSNGRVLLINPNGIVIGAGAQINVAGFIASTLGMSDDDFLGGRLRFAGGLGKAVENNGEINAAPGGQVYLVGPAVKNSGIITAPGGEVVLAAGNSVELVTPGTPNLRVEINAPDNQALNLGQIVAESGRVGIYAGLIDQKGTVRADAAVAGEGGRILLKATKNISLDAGSVTSANGPNGGRIEISAGDTTLVAGAVEAKGTAGQGGTIHVLGDKVGVYGNARVDVSGETGGGTVLVGGDFQGKPGVTAVSGEAIRNSSATYLGADATVAADAVASGNGGKVILWSDGSTRSYGAISARGGAASGDGGLVETSGKGALEVTRGPDTRAPNGLGGTWLLDPNNLIVDFGSVIVANTAQPLFSTLGPDSIIGVDLINLQLDAGSDVILTTTSMGPLPGLQPGNITIRAPIIKRAFSTLALPVGTTNITVRAHNNIVIEGAGRIAATENGGIQADRLNVTLTADIDNTGGGSVTVGGGGIATRGGTVTISGRDMVAINTGIDTTRGGINPSAGTVSLTGDSMDVTAPVNAGNASISVQQRTSSRPMNLGTKVAGALSLVQSDLSNLITSGPVSFGNGATGAFTVSSPVSAGSSQVTMTSGTSFNVAGGGSLSTGSPLFLSAPMMAIDGTVSAPEITINGPFQVSLGDGAGGGLHLDANELNRLATGVLRISGTAFTVQGAISRTGILRLTGSSLEQDPGATISAENLRLVNFGTVDLPEANVITNLAGNVSTLNLTNAATLNINPVDGANNLSTFNASFMVDDYNAVSLLTGSTVTIMSRPAAPRTLNIGGADVGGQLNVSAADLLNTLVGTVNLKGDNANIGGAVSASGNTALLTIAPMTATRGIGVVAGKTGSALEFMPSELVNVSVGSFTLGDPFTGPVTVGAALDGPTTIASVGVFTLRSGDRTTAGGLTLNAPVTANGNLVLTSDSLNLNALAKSNSGSLIVVPNDSAFPIDLGSKPALAGIAAALGLLPGETALLSAPNLFIGDPFGNTSGGVTVSGMVAFTGGIGTLNINNNGPFNVAPGAHLHAPGNIFVSASDITTSGAVASMGPGAISLSSFGDMTINGAVTTTAGGISLAANDIAISSAVTANGGGVNASGGNIAVSGAVTANGGGVNFFFSDIAVSGAVTANNGSVDLFANNVAISGPVTANTGSVNIGANSLAVSADVRTNTAGDINVAPLGANIQIGGSGTYLTETELQFFKPASGVLRIGNDFDTGNITIVGNISPATGSAGVLSLITGDGSITQTGGTITISALAANASGNVFLNLGNAIDAVALASDGGSAFITSVNPLTIGTVDGLSGITAFSGAANIVANTLQINNDISAGSVFIAPLPPVPGPAPINRPLSIVDAKGGGALELTPTELGRINSPRLVLGSSVTGNVTVATAAPLDFTASPIGALELVAGPAHGVFISSPVLVGDLSVTGDSMQFTGLLTAGHIRLNTASAPEFLVGGADAGPSPGPRTLGLDATDLGNLNTPNLSLATGAGGNITIDTPLDRAGGVISLTADDFAINPAGSVSAANVNLTVLTSARSVDLGGANGGDFSMPQTELDRISATGLFTLSAGEIHTPAPAGVVLPGANAALRFNTSDFSNPVVSAGRLTVSARDNFAFDLAGAGLTPAAISNLRPAGGVLQFGDFGTGDLIINQALTPHASVGTVALVAIRDITQSAVITAPQLRVQSFDGDITLTQNNLVGTLAGGALDGNFTFTNAQALTIGTVDSTPGIDGSNFVLRTDALAIAPGAAINSDNAVLAPRNVDATMTLGTNPGPGLFGLSTAELGQINSSALTFGDTSSTGNVTVNGAMQRNAGVLAILAKPDKTVDINAALGAPSGVTVDAGTINVNGGAPVSSSSGSVFLFARSPATLNVNGPVTAGSDIFFSSAGAANVSGALSAGGSVSVFGTTLNLAAITAGGGIELDGSGVVNIGGAVNAGSFIDIFGTTVNLNAPVTSQFSGIFVNTSGTGAAVNVSAPMMARFGVDIFSNMVNVTQPITSEFGNVSINTSGTGNSVTTTATAPITARSNITITTDTLALGATINATSSTVTLRQATNNRAISLGAEVATALSLDADELGRIGPDVDTLNIGNFNSGPITISAPIVSSTLSDLNLTSGGSITQAAGAPIRLLKQTTGPTGIVTRFGDLDASSGASVDLRAANEVPGFISGGIGANGTFEFNNVLPIRVQNNLGGGLLNIAQAVVTNQRVRINGGLFGPLPPPPPEGFLNDALFASLLAALDRIDDIGDFDKDAEEKRKEDEEKRKKGSPVCD